MSEVLSKQNKMYHTNSKQPDAVFTQIDTVIQTQGSVHLLPFLKHLRKDVQFARQNVLAQLNLEQNEDSCQVDHFRLPSTTKLC